jgi:hypothetical protein
MTSVNMLLGTMTMVVMIAICPAVHQKKKRLKLFSFEA